MMENIYPFTLMPIQEARIYGFNAKAYLYRTRNGLVPHSFIYLRKRRYLRFANGSHTPLYGESVELGKNKHKLGLFILYNAWKKAEEYGLSGSTIWTRLLQVERLLVDVEL